MKSRAQSPVSGSNSSESTNPRQFSLKNLQLCPQLQKQLNDIAIQRVFSDLLKALLAIKRKEFIGARNRMDVPHGMFGLSLDNFYARRNENTVYIDVLQLVCKETLDQAKVCIVLDDLQDFVSRLFLGYQTKKMIPILDDIKNSVKLLTINETIASNFKKNSETLQKLRDKLNAFNVRERNAVAYMNSQVYGVQNNCAEAEIVLDPIEFRYKLNFHNGTTEQSELQLLQVEEELQEKLDHLQWTQNREDIVTDCVRIKQRMDIDMLKLKIMATSDQYDCDYDSLDAQISYKTNAIQIMRDQYTDHMSKLKFFASEMIKLREWEEMWNWKKHDREETKKEKKKS